MCIRGLSQTIISNISFNIKEECLYNPHKKRERTMIDTYVYSIAYIILNQYKQDQITLLVSA